MFAPAASSATVGVAVVPASNPGSSDSASAQGSSISVVEENAEDNGLEYIDPAVESSANGDSRTGQVSDVVAGKRKADDDGSETGSPSKKRA